MAQDQGKAVEKALKAYGIGKNFVMGAKVYDDGRVVVVTHGGAKVTWREGVPVEKEDRLDFTQITGLPLKPRKRNVVAGKDKQAKK